MKSLEAIRMSKFGNKKLRGADLMGEQEVPKADTLEPDRDFRGIKNGVKDGGPFPTANTMGSSLDLIKSSKVSPGKVPSAGKYIMKEKEPEYEAQVEFGDTEVQPYSPIKKYLKKGR